MTNFLKSINEILPPVVVVGGILWVLFVAFFESQVQTIARAEIIQAMPTSVGFKEIKTEIQAMKGTIAATNGVGRANTNAVMRLEDHITRVEGKLDGLITIMMQRGQ